MNVYFFYKIDSSDEILYGVTNNKKYAKKFMDQRNMKKFRLEIEDMDNDEYASYCNSNEHRSCVLEEHELVTVKDGKHTSSNFYLKTIIMSYWEHQIIDDYSMFYDDLQNCVFAHGGIGMPIPIIFKKKYFNILEKLEYTLHFNLYVLPSLSNDLCLELDGKLPSLESYDIPGIENDELAIFINTCRESF